MGPDLYVSHVPSDIEPVSLLVDFFEASVPGLEGRIGCTSLPGYTPEGGLHMAHATVIGVVDGWMPEDVANELLLLAQHAQRVIILVLRGGPVVEVPPALSHLHQFELHEAVLSMLAEDLTHAVAARARTSDEAADTLEELLSFAARISTVPPLQQAAPSLESSDGPITESQRTAYRVFGVPSESVADTPLSDTVAIGGGPQRTSSLVPMPRGPSGLLSTSAGCAMSEVVFGGNFGEAERIVLDGEFAEFMHGLGGDWFRLRSATDAEEVAQAVDVLLRDPAAGRASLRHWYDAGYQLTLFCCLCACEGAREVTLQSQLAQARGRAWNAFWNATAEIGLPDHTVTALSALLEDVDAPSGARIEAAQCIEVLRNAAYEWDHARRVPGGTDLAVQGSAG